MKAALLMMILAAAIGTSVAWSVNYSKYGRRDAVLGPMTLDGRVTAENALEVIAQDDAAVLPKAEVIGEPTHDFGVMAPNQTGEHTFIIKNSGQGTLTLTLGATTCKCTLGELGKEELAPGEETEITLSWTVKTKGSYFNQSAEVRTNDPAKLALRLQVSGTVVRKIALVPEAWTIGEIAAGEPFEVGGKIYSYFENAIVPTKQSFSNKELTELTEFEVKPFTPGEDDQPHSTAPQGFEIIAKVKPGMRQGALSVNFLFGFQKKDENGQIIPPAEGDEDPNDYVSVEVAGRIVGALSMIEGTKLRSASGSYIYDFGRLGKEESLKAKAFVVLKGSERESTNLTIGEVTPSEFLKASLGAPLNRRTMVLYPLELEIVPGKETLDYSGRSEFGSVWIESDNPKVAKMRLAVKFVVDPRP